MIEQARLIAGASYRAIAREFGCHRDAAHRHMQHHVSPALRAEYMSGVNVKELAQKATDEGLTTLQYLAVVRSTLMHQFQLASSCNDRHGASALAGRLIEALREAGKLSGEILRTPGVVNVNNTVNFVNSPDFVNLQQMLIRRLARHPEAMADVIDGLRELETRSALPASPPLIEHQGGAHAA